MNHSGPKSVEKPSTTVHDVSLEACLTQYDLELTPDGQYIRWGSKNPHHPRNWGTARKVYDLTVITLMDLFVTAVSTAGTAAAKTADDEYQISQTLSIFLFVSVSLFGQLLGSLVFAPYSETFGRKKLYIGSGVLFSLGCVLIASVESLVGVVFGRAITGFLSAIPANILGGSIEDLYSSRKQAWWICIWSAASGLGLSLGPIMSVYITSALGWRWVFYVYAIIVAAVTGLTLFMRESRPSLLLGRQVATLRKVTGIDTPPALNPDHVPDMQTFVQVVLVRPMQLFAEPIVMSVGMMAGGAFGLIYLFTEALQLIYESLGFSPELASLSFVAIGIGILLSPLTRLLDDHIFETRVRAGLPLLPEHKLAGICIGAPAMAIGLWWFAWTIPPHAPDLPWIVPTVPLVLIGYALNEYPTVCLGYLADSYLSFSASAVAVVTCIRAVLSATFPLFTAQMFSSLGANVAVSILAVLATVFCFIPPLFVRYGTQIRAKSRFARYSLQTYKENCIHPDEFIQEGN
ncbi:MFS multidrug transporter [Aspergillus affinis]|uniref:MFS multidrug transporter n=1 Tax=Aspergillus affinis TaxID=1070780 RepID=UPI0022FF1C27|nr:MFS multidrug transporter [Aspergillus affinis]KAI9035779.1 MFS multidrug transporter [Aspergillus affinis]